MPGSFVDDSHGRGPFQAITQAQGSDAAIDLDRNFPSRTASDAPPSTMSAAEALATTHPDYDDEVQKWRKYLDLYESNNIYRFIHRHLREDDEIWKRRIERGYFYNYVKSVVDIFTAFLFHAPIDRDPGSFAEEFERIYKNTDLNGSLWEVFWARVCTFAMVEGHVGVMVDMPPQEDAAAIETEEDRKNANFRPYLSMLHAHQILDWETDRFGNFIWVKIEVLRSDEERSWKEPVDTDTRFFIIWTRDTFEEWKLVKIQPLNEPNDVSRDPQQFEATKLREGAHDLGRVPLIIAKFDKKADHSWFGLSAVRDIADINIAILNWSSLGDEEIFERCLNVLTMEKGEGDMPVQLAHGNVLEYEPGGAKPEYLTPGPTALNLIMLWIKQALEEIRRLARVGGTAGTGDARQSSSGIAHAFQFLETNQALAAKANTLEQAETEVHQLIVDWLDGDEEFDGTIAYPDEFGVEDVLTLFQEMDMARTSLTSETAIKTLEKKLTNKLLAKESTKLRKKAHKEIEAEDISKPSIESMFGMQPPGGKGPPPPDPEGDGGPESFEDDEKKTEKKSQEATAA